MNNRCFGFFGGVPPGFAVATFFVPYNCPKSSRQVFKYLNRNFLFPQEHLHIFFQLVGQNIAKQSLVGKTEADNKNRSTH
jgi:hypothetical protein